MLCLSRHADLAADECRTGLPENGHRSEATKYNKSNQKLDNYISLLWKYRFYNDRLDDDRTGNANTQRPKTNFEQHSFARYTGGPLNERFSYFTEIG